MSFVDKLRKNKKSLFEQQTNESKAFVTKLQENKQKSLLNIKQDTSISNDNNQIEIDQKKKELQQAIKLEKEKRDLYLNQKNKESLKPQNILEANRKTTKIDEIRENAKNLQTYDDSELNKLNREYAELNGYESDKFVKSIGKTALNIPLKLADGALKSAESILIDAPLTLALNASEFIDGLDGSKDENRSNRLKELIATDLVDEGMKSLGWDDELYNKVENNSLVKRNNLGGAVVEGIGGMLPSMIGGGASKALGYGIRGLSAFGGGTEEAFQNNASTGDAIKYGLGNSVTEIATEWLTGGIPGVKGTSMGGLDKLVAKKLGQKSLDEISSSLAKEIIKYGYKIAGEGAEEALAEIINPILKNMTYSQDEKIDWNNVIESAIVGGLTSGILNAPEFKNNINTMNQTQKIPVNSIREDVNIYNLGENTAEDASKALKNKYNYLETDNSKINELRKSASKYFADSIETQNMINTYEKIIGDKNYNVIFDDTITNKDGNNVNAQIKTLNNGEIEIRINPNANRSGEFLIMHEVTHAIETDRMKKLVMDYANKHSDFKDALESLKRTYNTNDVSSEVLADISGQLFGNQEFINNLSMEQPNIFKKIYNKIVELANRLTGNSHEVLFIRDLKNKWESAYRNTTTEQAINSLNNETIYSILNNSKGKYVKADRQVISGNNPSVWQKQVENYINNQIRKGKDVNFIAQDGDILTITRDTAGKAKFRNEVTMADGTKRKLSDSELFTKLTAETHIDELAKVSKRGKNTVPDYKNHRFAQDGFNYRIAYFEDYNGDYYRITMSVGKNKNINTIYNIGKMQNMAQKKGNTTLVTQRSNGVSTGTNIPQSTQNVNSSTSTKYSMQENQSDTLLDKTIKRYDDLSKTNYIEYFRKDNGDVRVNLIDSNNNLVNQLDLWSNTEAIKQFGERLGNQLYNYATDNNQKINIGNDINNLGLETDYFMSHRPTQTGLTADNLVNENVETSMSKDIYDHPEYYFQMNEKSSKESMSILKKVKGNPDAEIIIYRATPGDKINRGDWITLSKTYAEWHNQSQLDGKGHILKMKVKAKDVQFAGDDINEFGYFPGGNVQNSISSKTWQNYLEENYRSTGTRTNMQNIRLLEDANAYITNQQKAKKNVSNESIVQYNKSKVEDPFQISQLTVEDASTTPILKDYKKQDSKIGDKQSKFYRNVTETSKMLDEDVRDMLKKEEDVKFYKSVTNEESLNRASTRLKEGGRAETDRWLSQEPEKADATDVAEGWILLKQYGDKIKEAKQSGNIAMADEYNRSLTQVAKKMGEMGTKAGQAIQAYNIMSRMTPEGMVYYAQDALNDAYSSLVKNKSKKWIERNQNKFTLTPEETTYIMQEMEAISKMKEGRGKKIRLGKIQTMIQNKIPSSFGDKTKTWMRISMLFNPKTQVRNITGNAVMVPMNAIADTFSAIMDKQISKSTGIRTVGLPNAKSMLQGAKKGLFDSYSDFKNDVNTRNMQGNRFEIKSGKAFDDNSSVGHVLNRIDKMLSFALDAGDRPFYESAFTNSINNQMILNNVDKPTTEMVEIATSEALQRTWQDNNKYTKLVLDIRKALNTVSLPENLPVLKRFSGYGLGDILIPFAKTPANLTKAIVDYSPVGLGKTLLTDAINLKNSLKNGQYSATLQHRFVQNLGKGMAGSLLYIMGYALAKAGIVTGENDDDKDVANFMKNNLGIQPYSIKIGDHTFTYDWAQPLAAPLAIGANIVQKQEEGKGIMDGIAISLNEGFNVILEQSFLQSINDVFSDAGKVPEKIFQEILEIPSRAVPTLFKQINDLIDPTVRTTFEYDNPVGSAINSVKNKIPGLSQTLSPQIDTMGREIKRYGGDNNIFNVFLNPANTNKGEMSDSAKEIYKVYQETGDKTILPRTAPYYIDQKGNRITFTAEQKAEFQSIAGQIIEDNVKKLNNNQNYKQLDFNEKAESIKGIVDYAYNYAREKVAGISMSNSYNKVKEWLTQGKQLSDYYANKDENNYSLQSPEKHFSISNFKIDYDKYTDYRKKVSSLKKKFPGKENTTIRKNEVYKYINSLPLNQYQKILLWKELGGYSISGYKNMMYKYINNLKISKKEKEIIWEELYGE